MHLVSDVCKEANLSNEDLRLILSDSRLDWADCSEITDAERLLILRSKSAALNGSTDITPVDPNAMPVEVQQKLVQTAGQVLNKSLALALAEEIMILDAIDETKNQIIISNHQNRQRELAQALGQDWQDTKVQYLDTLRSLSNHINSKVEVQADGIDAKAEIERIRQELGNLLTK